MSRESRINDLATRIATEINSVRNELVPYDSTIPPTNGQTLGFDGTNFVPVTSSGGLNSNTSLSVNQTSHGFVVGDVIRISGGTYIKSQADSAANSEVTGIVSEVIDVDNFIITNSGYITGLSGLIANEAYFLNPTVEGTMTITNPSVIGQISKPVFFSDSTTSGWVQIYRGVEVVSSQNALLVDNNLSDLSNINTARTNLGLEIGTDVQKIITVGTTPPASPSIGDLWVDTN